MNEGIPIEDQEHLDTLEKIRKMVHSDYVDCYPDQESLTDKQLIDLLRELIT